MPIFELACGNEQCSEYAQVSEMYFPRSEAQNPTCACGQEKKRLISGFSVVWTGPLTGKYLDRKLEGGQGDDGSHWAWRTRDEDGRKLPKPEPCFIENFQQQREFCKAEGLIDPTQIGPAEVHSDGKGVSTRGLPGAW